ncbi:Zinc finger protein 36, C3H1 type-like 3 [Microtus ochrogaster]|uniref:mRNA decay activator protein ZFP36 n=1 Tax=Microtus ochrogaster TaxID=79684 RepID=A0A8J6GEA7_MICOH|nr:Zinc finger protein 36, C3H1 type-like 3 [Microtus ochrogaster]
MSTLLWSVYNPDLMRRNGIPLANHNLNGMFNTHRAAPPSSSFLPGFIPPPAASNPQAFAHLVTRAVSRKRYKTELCRPFEESGRCRYGQKCQFAHGSRELRTPLRHPKYKTEPCRTFHSVGICPYGTRCHFIHNQHDHQALPSGSASEEPCSANGSDAGPSDTGSSGFNGEPKPMMQMASSVSSSSLPSGHSHPQQAPLLLSTPLLSSGMLLPPSYPAATLPATYCASMAAASATVSAAASAAAMLYQNGGGVPCTTCANHTIVISQAMGGYMAPVAFPTLNFAAANATTFYHSQQQNLASPMQFPMPLVRPPASILAPNSVAPMATAAIAPGAAAPTLVNPGASAAAAAVVPAATAAADTTSSASISAATAAEGPAQHFSLQLPGTQSESPDFDMLTSSLDSLLGTNNLDNLLSCSSSSSNLNDSESPRIKSSRRLPIFSRLSDSDK